MNDITSYAQNFEDVMLWRALSHVGKGFYIDVGAQDPVIDSVSLLFHEHGWQGIHVEPTPHYADLLRRSRAADVVIQAAVGLKGDELIPFYEIPESGISTADAGIAEIHRSHGLEVREIRVPCITLASIFQTVNQREIHWLKIDVEGFEYEVLAGWGAANIRPWIVVVESTLPLTRTQTHGKWESMLLGYGYTPVYFDGLNRYYTSVDHPELQSSFSLPPNIFDEFALNGTANAPFHRLIVSRYQRDLQTAADAARIIDSQRIRDLEIEVAGQRDEAARRTHDLTVALDRQRAAAETSARTLSEQQLLAREQGELLRASAQREELLIARLEVLQGQLSESQQRERLLHDRVAQYQEISRREIITLAEQQSAAAAEHQAERRALTAQLYEQGEILDAANQAKHEQELANLRQAELLLEAKNRETRAREDLALLSEQLREREQSSRKELERASLEHERARSLLSAQWDTERQQLLSALMSLQGDQAALKQSLSWRLTAPLRLFARTRPIPTQSSEVATQNSGDCTPQTQGKCRISITGVLNAMTSQGSDGSFQQTATDMKGLLALQHEVFVQCAYRTILTRDADADGLAHYTGRVLAGDPKIEILKDLYQSKEARDKGVTLPWLLDAFTRHAAGSGPIRRLARRLLGSGNVRAKLINRIALLEERLHYFELQLTRLHSQQDHCIRALEGRIVSLENEFRTARSHSGSEADTKSPREVILLGRSLVSKRILRDMSSAIRDANGGSGTRP